MAELLQLRRTLFSPRIDMSDANRQKQIDEVVQNGTPVASTPNYSNWNQTTGTRVIFKADNIVQEIKPSARQFDGYSAATARSENVTFGSVPIAGGDHYITFTATEKNASSTDYRMGIDSFTLSPSGCPNEAEEMAVRDDGGSTKVSEDMSSYGSWSGNRHLEYRASAVDDHISLNFYYDQWLETNFATSSPYYTVVEYSNRTGDGSEASGSNSYSARLDGFGASWSAFAQTGAPSKTAESVTVSGANGVIFRNIVLSSNVEVEGRAVRIRFDNMGAQDITVDSANIMNRASGPDGEAASRKQITFDGGSASAIIGAQSYKISDWIDMDDPATADVTEGFDKSRDYLVTAHLPLAAGTHAISSYPSPDTAAVHSYMLEGTVADAQDATWTGKAYSERCSVYTADSADASYFSYGTLTSQIYDTAVDNPSYGTLKWKIAKNNYGDYATGGLGADLIIKARSNDNKAALEAANDWTGSLQIDTLSQTAGSASISGIGTGRYVQFQAEFRSQPTAGLADYSKSCVLESVAIDWPGSARIVDVSGYFTKRPNYGIFSVKIDDKLMVKGLEVTLDVTANIHGSRSLTRSITAEAEPRNTGK